MGEGCSHYKCTRKNVKDQAERYRNDTCSFGKPPKHLCPFNYLCGKPHNCGGQAVMSKLTRQVKRARKTNHMDQTRRSHFVLDRVLTIESSVGPNGYLAKFFFFISTTSLFGVSILVIVLYVLEWSF